MAKAATVQIELIYALPREQIVETLQVPIGTTVGQAIAQSGIQGRYPEVAEYPMRVGIFGRRVEATVVLRQFDRIEIYRPLIAEPKQARRKRAGRTGNSKRQG